MNRFQTFILAVLLLLLSIPTQASHFVGGEMSYTCLGARTWKITLVLYRDCSGCITCFSNASLGSPLTPGLVAKPNTTLNPPGCTATPNLVNVNMTLQKVEDEGKEAIARCGMIAKNGCTNLNTDSAGPLTPSIEKWIFEGTLNLNLPSLNSSNCTYWDVSYTSNARNNGMSNMPSEDFSIGSTINIFNRSGADCHNSSPIYSYEPTQVFCANSQVNDNVGAIDPDDDSLSYEIGYAVKSYPGTQGTYLPPYSKTFPFPMLEEEVKINPLTGDFNFTPINNTSTIITGDLCIYVKQWSYDMRGNPLLVGITMRDLQYYVLNCPNPNGVPLFQTAPSRQPGYQPMFDFEIYGGQQTCFTITAKDTDVYPAIPRFDSTFISWNEGITRPGKTTFVPTYLVGPNIPRPREDSWQFCWQTDTADARNRPYYLTVKLTDNACPRLGNSKRTFSIRVLDPSKPPRIMDFTPKSGKSDTVVTITGADFFDITNVYFGNIPAKSFTVVNAQKITAVVGAGATGNVMVTSNRGNSILGIFTYINGTGIQESVLPSFQVFPNPVQQQLVIESKELLHHTTFELLNTEGKVVLQADTKQATSSFTIDVRHLTKGVYTLRITSPEESETVKVVKE